jgi:phage shock protein PspC (stress-responsive transcriptional regulator)
MEHTDAPEDQVDPTHTSTASGRTDEADADSDRGASQARDALSTSDGAEDREDAPTTDRAMPIDGTEPSGGAEPSGGDEAQEDAARTSPAVDYSDDEVLAAAGMGSFAADADATAEDRGTAQRTTTSRGKYRRWRRPTEDRLVAGVATAIADGAGLPLWFVRAAFAVSAFFGGLGVAAYLGAWAVLPSGDATHSLSDRWRDRWDEADRPSERAGLIVIAAAALLAISATGLVAGPITLAVVLTLVGISMLQPKSA